jgi:hypothetical protein
MRKLLAWLGVGLLASGSSFAQSAVTVMVDSQALGFSIPDDFAGLSFETGSELPNRNRVRGHLFCAANQELISLFQNAGIHNLRLGGGTVDSSKTPIPGFTEVSNVFAFVKAVGNLNVIYSLRLLNGDASGDCSLPADACLAGYVWKNFSSMLAGFSIGNEPDFPSYHKPDPRITDYPSYLTDWSNFAERVRLAAPSAKFFGPDTGSWSGYSYYKGKSWTQRFAEDHRGLAILAGVTQHYYAGGHPERTTAEEAIDKMLSAAWVTNDYPTLFSNNLAPALSAGFRYRFTEANDYLGGITNASNSYASALWALDFMHWWAVHGCAGVNFHNKSWLCTDTIYLDSNGKYEVNPKVYGIKAFDLGGHGQVKPASISNPNGINLAAYAVSNTNTVYLTVINKEHGARGRSAVVSIAVTGVTNRSAEAIFLTAPQGDTGARAGVSLGGELITGGTPWHGKWVQVKVEPDGTASVVVPVAAAVVVRLRS